MTIFTPFTSRIHHTTIHTIPTQKLIEEQEITPTKDETDHVEQNNKEAISEAAKTKPKTKTLKKPKDTTVEYESEEPAQVIDQTEQKATITNDKDPKEKLVKPKEEVKEKLVTPKEEVKEKAVTPKEEAKEKAAKPKEEAKKDVKEELSKDLDKPQKAKVAKDKEAQPVDDEPSFWGDNDDDAPPTVNNVKKSALEEKIPEDVAATKAKRSPSKKGLKGEDIPETAEVDTNHSKSPEATPEKINDIKADVAKPKKDGLTVPGIEAPSAVEEEAVKPAEDRRRSSSSASDASLKVNYYTNTLHNNTI